MSILATAIHTHRYAGLLAAGCSFGAALCRAAAPEPSYFSASGGLRGLFLGMAVLLTLGAGLLALASAISALVVVANAPPNSGVVGRFVSAAAFAGLALAVVMFGPRGWRGPDEGTLVVAALLFLVAMVLGFQVWTTLARASGNDQLADDLRTAFIATVTGSVLSRLAGSTDLPFIALLGLFAAVPGLIMTFKALGSLARQFQYGAAWST